MFYFQNQHLHPDDSRSESSGETISGDSGRGSNEEDAPNTSPSGNTLTIWSIQTDRSGQTVYRDDP